MNQPTEHLDVRVTPETADWLRAGHVPGLLISPRFGQLYKLEPVREVIVAIQEAAIFGKRYGIPAETWELLP